MPNIKTGSRTIFVSAPKICAIIGLFHVSACLMYLCPYSVHKQGYTSYADYFFRILRLYSHYLLRPCRRFDISAHKTVLITANTSQLDKCKHTPTPAVSCALSSVLRIAARHICIYAYSRTDSYSGYNEAESEILRKVRSIRCRSIFRQNNLSTMLYIANIS